MATALLFFAMTPLLIAQTGTGLPVKASVAAGIAVRFLDLRISNPAPTNMNSTLNCTRP